MTVDENVAVGGHGCSRISSTSELDSSGCEHRQISLQRSLTSIKAQLSHRKDEFAWTTCIDTRFDHFDIKEAGDVLLIRDLPMYKGQDCLDPLELLPRPIPNVWTGIRGGRPGIPRIGRS